MKHVALAVSVLALLVFGVAAQTPQPFVPKQSDRRHRSKATNRNSGINYRSSVIPDTVTPENTFAMRGYQFDLDGPQRWVGNNYEEKGRLFLSARGQITRVVGTRPPVVVSTFGNEADLAQLATDDWNAVHISARGNAG